MECWLADGSDGVEGAQMAMETATALAQKSLQQTLQGKLSVSVLAPSVKVSFGGNKDLHVLPDAPKELIEQVLKKQVRHPGDEPCTAGRWSQEALHPVSNGTERYTITDNNPTTWGF